MISTAKALISRLYTYTHEIVKSRSIPYYHDVLAVHVQIVQYIVQSKNKSLTPPNFMITYLIITGDSQYADRVFKTYHCFQNCATHIKK